MPVGGVETQQQGCQLRIKQVMRAIHTRDTETALGILAEMDRRGEDVDVQLGKSQNRTLLMEALMDNEDNYRIVEKLLQMRASTFIKDNYGENAFHHALRAAQYETISMMVKLSHNTRKNRVRYDSVVGGMFEHRNDGCTPLHVGLKAGRRFQAMRPLMQAECDTSGVFNLANRAGHTVFHFAVMYGNGQGVHDMLKNEGTDNDIPDRHGVTPFAMSSGNQQIRDIFLRYRYTGDRAQSLVFKHEFNDPIMGLATPSYEEESPRVPYALRRQPVEDTPKESVGDSLEERMAKLANSESDSGGSDDEYEYDKTRDEIYEEARLAWETQMYLEWISKSVRHD